MRSILKVGSIEGISRALNWLLVFILAMIFDVETFGIISLIIALESVLIAFFIFGMDKVFLRFLPLTKESHLIKKVHLIWILNSILITSLIFLILEFSKVKDALNVFNETDIFLIVFISLLASYQKIIIAFYRAKDNFIGFFCNRFLIQISRVLLILTISIYTLKYEAYLFASLAALSFILLNIFYLRSSIFLYIKEFDSTINTRLILLFSLPFIPHMLSSACLSYIDRVMLTSIQGLEAAGNYSFSYVLGSSIVFIYGIVASFYEPLLYKLKNKLEIEKIQSFVLYLLICLACFVGLFLELILILFSEYFLGKGYSNIDSIFRVIFFSHLIYAFYLISNYQLTISKKTKAIAIGTFIAAIINISLNLYLIPIQGEMGAAFSTFISYLFLVSCVIFSSKIFSYKSPLNKKIIYLFSCIFAGLISILFIDVPSIIVLLLLIAYSFYSLYKFLKNDESVKKFFLKV